MHTKVILLNSQVKVATVRPQVGELLGPERYEQTGKWTRLHNKELYALYSSPNIIRVINSRRLGWARHVARMAESRGA